MKATNRRFTVVALLFAIFLAAMEATAIATVMPTIVGDLGGIEHYAWVFTAYMMASTVTVPIFGKLADIFGRKPVMIGGILVFLLGSLLSGSAKSMQQLIFFRALQGTGGGAMQPMGLTIAGDIFSLEERAKTTAIFGAVWGLAGVMGPALGALIVELISWPWIFYINIPFGIIAIVLLQLNFHERVKGKAARMDVAGALLLSGTIVSLLVAVNYHQWTKILLPSALVFFSTFLLVEKNSSSPLVPLHLFKNKVIGVASMVGFLLGAGMLASVSYLPLYLQGVLQKTPAMAGAAIMPMAIGWPIASSFSARLMHRYSFRSMIRAGLVLCLMATILTASTVIFKLPVVILGLGMGMLGLGMGLTNTPLLLSVQSSVSWEERGIATASTIFFRTIGGTLAVGLLGGVLAAALLKNPNIPLSVANNLLGPEHGKNLSAEILSSLSIILDVALKSIFFIVVAITACAFFVGQAFPRVHFHPKGVKDFERDTIAKAQSLT